MGSGMDYLNLRAPFDIISSSGRSPEELRPEELFLRSGNSPASVRPTVRLYTILVVASPPRPLDWSDLLNLVRMFPSVSSCAITKNKKSGPSTNMAAVGHL